MAEWLKTHKKLLRGLISGLAGIVLALTLWAFGALDTWEASTWDRRVRLLAKPGKATDEIRLILLDQPSLDWAEDINGLAWPWPREIFAAIVDYCQRSGVKALAFDVLFTEFSKYNVEDDAALGNAIAKLQNFAASISLKRESEYDVEGDAASISLEKESESKNHWPDGFPDPEYPINGLDEWLGTTQAEGIVAQEADIPIPEVAKNAGVICNVNQKADFDGVYRRIKLFNVFDNKIFPALGLGSYLTAMRDVQMQIEPGRLIVGEKSIPIDNEGNAILNYRGPSETHTFHTAGEILQAEIRFVNGDEPTKKDTEISRNLQDKYVIFGYSAPGLYDLRRAPFGGVYTGVEINATVLDNLLSDDFIAEVPKGLTMAFVVLLGVACGVFASFFSKPLHYVLISVVYIAVPILFSIGSYAVGFWLPLAVQITAASTTIILSLVLDYATEGQQRRFIKNAFKQYLSPAVIEQLIQDPEQLKLGGERKVLSIFFSDLQGFTSISERLTPEELTTLLNEYLSEMADIIHKEGGTIDKYEGDAIIAFWNAPLNVPDHAVRVVRAALYCQKTLAELRPLFKKRAGKELFMRIGMNTGPAVVGNMGSRTRFDYTMLGDAVNLAARLEGVNKQFGTYTMISQSTLDLCGDTFAVRELARVAVVGRGEAVTVYEPMFHEEYEARKDVLETFVQGLNLFYHGNFEEAIKIFTRIHKLDPAAAAYKEKCYTLRNAQPENWQGVWVMTTK